MNHECPACGDPVNEIDKLCRECEGVLKEDGHIYYLHKERKEKAAAGGEGSASSPALPRRDWRGVHIPAGPK